MVFELIPHSLKGSFFVISLSAEPHSERYYIRKGSMLEDSKAYSSVTLAYPLSINTTSSNLTTFFSAFLRTRVHTDKALKDGPKGIPRYVKGNVPMRQ
jgi:hypothetical protein